MPHVFIEESMREKRMFLPPLSKQTHSPVNFRPATQRGSDHLPPVPRIVLEHVGTRAECPGKTSATDDETKAPWRFQRGWGLHREGKWLPIPHNLLQICMQKNQEKDMYEYV
jgi:hypothetical protein